MNVELNMNNILSAEQIAEYDLIIDNNKEIALDIKASPIGRNMLRFTCWLKEELLKLNCPASLVSGFCMEYAKLSYVPVVKILLKYKWEYKDLINVKQVLPENEYNDLLRDMWNAAVLLIEEFKEHKINSIYNLSDLN
jgi:hypothetical protein